MSSRNAPTPFAQACTGLLLISCVAPGEGQVEILARFDAGEGEHPEAVVVSVDGTIAMSLHESMRLWRRDSSGRESVLQLPGADDPSTRLNGLAQLDGTLWGLVRSDDSDWSGVWRLDDPVERVVPLDAGAELNGLAADPSRVLLYATDDDGRVLAVDPAAQSSAVWSSHPDLAPRNDRAYGAGTYGANGIAVTSRAIWVSVPATSSVVSLPIRQDGTAGDPVVELMASEVGVIDDFDLDSNGRWIGAALADNALRLVDRGAVRDLATRGDEVDQPTAVVFDPSSPDSAFLTNGAFFRLGQRQPTLMRVTWSDDP